MDVCGFRTFARLQLFDLDIGFTLKHDAGSRDVIDHSFFVRFRVRDSQFGFGGADFNRRFLLRKHLLRTLFVAGF